MIADPQKLAANLYLLNIADLNFLLNYSLADYKGLRLQIINELKSRPSIRRINFLQTFNYQNESVQIYRQCADFSCATQVVKSYLETHSIAEAKILSINLNIEIRRSQQLIFASSLVETPQFKHNALFYQALTQTLTQKP